jgi:hypothetical protein
MPPADIFYLTHREHKWCTPLDEGVKVVPLCALFVCMHGSLNWGSAPIKGALPGARLHCLQC